MTTSKQIRVLVLPVGEPAYEATFDTSHEQDQLQSIVGGDFAPVDIDQHVTVWCSEEALRASRPIPNRVVVHGTMFGPLVLSRTDPADGSLASLTDEDVAVYSNAFPVVQ